MADFCKQCSIENFGEDFQDLAGLDVSYGVPGLLVQTLCEGCGDAIVKPDGTCVSNQCLKRHGDANVES